MVTHDYKWFPTVSAYVDSEVNVDVIKKDEDWISKHVTQSQFCLQIMKCDSYACCIPFRSSIKSVLENSFLPPPILLAQTADGIVWADSGKNSCYAILTQACLLKKRLEPARAKRKFPKQTPFDFSCGIIKSELPNRICKVCVLYHGKDEA